MTKAHNNPYPWVCGDSGASHATTLGDAMAPKLEALGLKYDGDKPRLGLVPPKALLEVAKVLTYGAKKYSAENWRHVDGKEWRYFDAAQRHLWQYHSGQKYDPETKVNHIAHAICSLLFILELDLEDDLKPTP